MVVVGLPAGKILMKTDKKKQLIVEICGKHRNCNSWKMNIGVLTNFSLALAISVVVLCLCWL